MFLYDSVASSKVTFALIFLIYFAVNTYCKQFAVWKKYILYKIST